MNISTIDPIKNIQKAFVNDFISLPEKESFWQRLKGSSEAYVKTNIYK